MGMMERRAYQIEAEKLYTYSVYDFLVSIRRVKNTRGLSTKCGNKMVSSGMVSYIHICIHICH